jgi:hypothetical protein
MHIQTLHDARCCQPSLVSLDDDWGGSFLAATAVLSDTHQRLCM